MSTEYEVDDEVFYRPVFSVGARVRRGTIVYKGEDGQGPFFLVKESKENYDEKVYEGSIIANGERINELVTEIEEKIELHKELTANIDALKLEFEEEIK